MRISDWSSDVCASDLGTYRQSHVGFGQRWCIVNTIAHKGDAAMLSFQPTHRIDLAGGQHFGYDFIDTQAGCNGPCSDFVIARDHGDLKSQVMQRSEEHTSELQSLMRTSYAVFCLKKNNNQHNP